MLLAAELSNQILTQILTWNAVHSQFIGELGTETTQMSK